MEDYAYVLDYLAEGRPEEKGYKHESLVLALGQDEFKLFELTPKDDVTIEIGEKVYIGKDLERRDKIKHVKRRIRWDELTHTAQGEVPFVVKDIIHEKEDRFIQFFNDARPVTKRYHMLELLPGMGRKKMESVLDERKNGPFKDFDDLVKRVPIVHKPKKLVKERIVKEIENPEIKYKVWVAE